MTVIKYLASAILVIASCSCTQAQFIFTPKKPIGTLIETIDKYEACQLTGSIPFSAIKVIDSRYDTTVIGFYIDEFLALKDSSQPLALQHTIDKYYQHLYMPGRDTLVLQLEQLSIQDRVMDDTSFILTGGYISCREYSGSDSNYRYIGSADTMMQEKKDYHTLFQLHKNGKHTNYEFWDFYLLRLCEAMIRKAAVSPVTGDTTVYYSRDAIKQEGLQKRKKPVLTADSLAPGFYRNFSEFVNNDPGFLYKDSETLQRLLEVMHYRVGKTVSGETPDTSYWGYCNGKNLYIRNGYNFYQLERRDARFYIAPTLDARRRDVNRGALNFVTGLALLTTGIAANDGVHFQGFNLIQPPDIPTIVLPVQGVYLLCLALDWDNGAVFY